MFLGHTCIIVFKYADNMDLRKDVEKAFWFQAVSNATFSVDTFFFIRWAQRYICSLIKKSGFLHFFRFIL